MNLLNLENIDRYSADSAGQFEGKFLLAMPSLGESVFDRSIIYICAHSHDGAMGFQVNKTTSITFDELIEKTDLGNESGIVVAPSTCTSTLVRNGGPVDEHRGFVLHSGDYDSEATIPISDNVFLTSNVQILRSIVDGHGPEKAAISLGYAGWGPGQLEQEIAENAWLTIDANPEIVFDNKHEKKYEKLLGSIGIEPAHFIAEGGTA